MKFIDLNTADIISKDRIKTIASVSVIVLLCAAGIIIMRNLLEAEAHSTYSSIDDSIQELAELTDVSDADTTVTTEAQLLSDTHSTDVDSASNVPDSTDTTDATTSEVDASAVTSDTTSSTVTEEAAVTSASEVGETDEMDVSAESTVAPSSETTLTEPTATSEAQATATPVPQATSTPIPTSTPVPTATPTPTPAFTETDLILVVYASSELNVRRAPSTSSDVVKTLNPGDAIDVIASTSNGWYKTYNNNYVLAELTTQTPPATPSPVPTATPVPQATAAPVPQEPTEAQTVQIDGNNLTLYGSCTITFYGPQPLGDGTYSYRTATGTTCTQGRTCAADWGVFPSGTTIYIENDPLGGDGYYTVEDRGPGVQGSHIDIFAEDGESNAYNTTTRNVYIVS